MAIFNIYSRIWTHSKGLRKSCDSMTKLLSCEKVVMLTTLGSHMVVINVNSDACRSRLGIPISPLENATQAAHLLKITYSVLFKQVNQVDDQQAYNKVVNTILSFFQLT